MPISFISTDNAPKAIGPYSQGAVANGFIYTAGQIALDPTTREVVTGDVKAQTEQVMASLQAILKAQGSDFSKVVKTTVYLVTMDDFAAMNEVYAKWLGEHRPARSTVAVAGLPRNVRVEIDVVALA